MGKTRTLKEIALELLERYRESEARWIDEFCVNIEEALGSLDKEISDYKREIENAKT